MADLNKSTNLAQWVCRRQLLARQIWSRSLTTWRGEPAPTNLSGRLS